MRTWTLALLAVALLGAGFGIHALVAGDRSEPTQAPVAGLPPGPGPVATPPPAREPPPAALPSGPPAPTEAGADAPTLGGGGTLPSTEEIVAEATKRARKYNQPIAGRNNRAAWTGF